MSNYIKNDILKLVEESGVKFIHLQFTDILGMLKNVAITSEQLKKALDNKCMFDGSSIEGFGRIEESDMYLSPDPDSYAIFPWKPQTGKIARLICNVLNPDGTPFEGDPRHVLQRVLKKAAELGYEKFNVGPECEFFLFLTDNEGKPTVKTHDNAGYFDLGPVDLGEDSRRDICIALEEMGFEIEASHHEVAPGQHEIDFRYQDALTTADNIMTIKKLESRLGGQLFARVPKGITLTPEGEVLFKYIEQGYNMILLAESKFIETINLDMGIIRIGASDMTLKYFLLPYLEEFHKQYPRVRIKVTNGPSPETVNFLKTGAIDFGVVSLPLANYEAIDVFEVMEIQDCFVANSNFAELKSRVISIKDLAGYPIIMLEKNTSTRHYIDDYLSRHSVSLIPEFELATSDLIVQFARIGLGISCVVRNFADKSIKNGTLFEITLEEKIPPRHIGIIKLCNVPLTAAAKKLVELIKSKTLPDG